jgi:hypothetical protein
VDAQPIKVILTAHLFKQMPNNFALLQLQAGKSLMDLAAIYAAPHMDVFLLVVSTQQLISFVAH